MCLFFFFNDTATTEIYTLSLHDALPICWAEATGDDSWRWDQVLPFFKRHEDYHKGADDLHGAGGEWRVEKQHLVPARSEEHTSELQSPDHLVCRLLLEKKKKQSTTTHRK